MAVRIPSAEISPRNDNGILKFYEGNTFVFQLDLELKDQDGTEIILNNETSSVVVTFFDYKNRPVKVFSFGKNKDEMMWGKNIIELDFDEETTGLFEKGKYSYDCVIEIDGIGKRTIIDRAPVFVE